jgi:hypothetical protein
MTIEERGLVRAIQSFEVDSRMKEMCAVEGIFGSTWGIGVLPI